MVRRSAVGIKKGMWVKSPARKRCCEYREIRSVGGSRSLGKPEKAGTNFVIISEPYRCRMINAKGLFIREGSRVKRDAHNMGRYVIAAAEESETGREVSINEVDIDNFIRAKGAIFSAIDIRNPHIPLRHLLVSMQQPV